MCKGIVAAALIHFMPRSVHLMYGVDTSVDAARLGACATRFGWGAGTADCPDMGLGSFCSLMFSAGGGTGNCSEMGLGSFGNSMFSAGGVSFGRERIWMRLAVMRVSIAQARRWRQKAESISSTKPTRRHRRAGSARRTRSACNQSPCAIRVSRTTHLAIRPWRVAFLAERAFPAGVIGPLERAPLALDEIVRRIEDIALLQSQCTMAQTRVHA